MNGDRRCPSRRTMIRWMGAGLAGAAFMRNGLAAPAQASAADSLGVIAERAGLAYGCATTADQLGSDPVFAAAVAAECRILVTELDLKWDILSPERGVYRFAGADAMADFAERHGMTLRGHPLAWHQALPGWVWSLGPGEWLPEIESHIRALMGRYRGRIASWDVVNEPLDPDVTVPDGLRRGPWFDHLGADYVAMAFDLAGRTDPEAELVVNEYGLIFDTDYARARRAHMLRLVDRVIAAGSPIHAVGLQCHLRLDDPPIDAGGLALFSAALADRGLSLLVTELDVDDRAGPYDDRNRRDTLVAARYAELIDAVMPLPTLSAVLTWGLADRHSWIRHDPTHPFGNDARPLLLDDALDRKDAWHKLADAFNARG